MTGQQKNRVRSIEELVPGIFKMTLESEEICTRAVPGQFVNVKCCDGNQALLRRPISICTVDRRNSCYDLLFQKKGGGTGLLACKKPGDTVDVLGPLGNGFDLDARYERIAVAGGGIGIFPLLFLLNESKAVHKSAYLGFRSKELVVLEEAFRNSADVLKIATDDGSYGTHGYVTDLLKKDMETESFDMVYSCGPTPMLKGVVQLANERGTACQISMEQRMGCGFGACLVCACKTHAAGDDWQYSHVCKDGPVFNGNNVIFE